MQAKEYHDTSKTEKRQKLSEKVLMTFIELEKRIE